MTTKSRSCSVISSTVCNAKTRRHYGFLSLTVSCFLPASVRYTVTCYRVFSPRRLSIRLSARHIQPSIIVSLSLGHDFPDTLSCVLEAIDEGFGNTSKPKDSNDEEMRHLGAFLNE